MIKINSTLQEALQLKTWSYLLRLIPTRTPGKARLARFLIRRYFSLKDIKIQTRDNLFLVPNLKEPIAFYILIDGVYEPLTLKFILEHLRSGKIFVDVGANIGTFTLPSSRKVGPKGRVIAVEPSPFILNYLKHNLTINGISNVTVCEAALYDSHNLSLPFYEAPPEKFGMGSLSTQFHDHPVSVAAKTLDSLLEELKVECVDVLKVDVEGLESSVFRGAAKLLKDSNAPLILFEFCDWAEERAGFQPGASQKFLSDLGYTIWRLADYLKEEPALASILTTGSEMLVARKS